MCCKVLSVYFREYTAMYGYALVQSRCYASRIPNPDIHTLNIVDSAHRTLKKTLTKSRISSNKHLNRIVLFLHTTLPTCASLVPCSPSGLSLILFLLLHQDHHPFSSYFSVYKPPGVSPSLLFLSFLDFTQDHDRQTLLS